MACTLTSGCGVSYLTRLAYQQLRFLGRARPISEVLTGEHDPERRARLELVLAVRKFAKANGLDPGGSYLKVSETGDLAMVHVVTAAYVDRLEPYTWHYPIVGRLPYRGYFDRDAAERLAARLRKEGLDTRVVPAGAYSTLGWFDDPLPSSLLDVDRVSLATTVLHELVHRRLFVRGKVEFNESLANAVALRLAPAFFLEEGDVTRVDEAERRHREWLARSELYDDLAARLVDFFARAHDEGYTRAEILAGRQDIYARAQAEFAGEGLSHGKGDFDDGTMDNARFLALYRYACHGHALDAFLDSFDSIEAALTHLESHLAGVEGPYDALAVAPDAALGERGAVRVHASGDSAGGVLH